MSISAPYYKRRSDRMLLTGCTFLVAFIAFVTFTATLALYGNPWAWTSAAGAIAALLFAIHDLRDSARCRRAHLSRRP